MFFLLIAFIHALKSFFNFLCAEEHFISNPKKSIALSKQERRLPKNTLTEQKVMEILESCDTKKLVGLRNRAILETAYACGIRTAELCRLKAQEIDLGKQTELIKKGKGNISRLVPLGQYATFFIQEYLKRSCRYFLREKRTDSEYLFLTQFENPYNRKSINRSVMKSIQRKSGFKKNLTVYSFRHAVAGQLLQHNLKVAFIVCLR